MPPGWRPSSCWGSWWAALGTPGATRTHLQARSSQPWTAWYTLLVMSASLKHNTACFLMALMCLRAGSPWDAAAAAALGPVVRHVCMPKHDTRLGGWRDKELLRTSLAFLLGLTAAVPNTLWCDVWRNVRPSACASAHHCQRKPRCRPLITFKLDTSHVLLCTQVGGTFWLSRLARDREATVRAAAWSVLARLALPAAPATRRMLLQSWPDCGTTAVRVSLHRQGAGLLSVWLPDSDAAHWPTSCQDFSLPLLCCAGRPVAKRALCCPRGGTVLPERCYSGVI